MKLSTIISLLVTLCSVSVYAQKVTVVSPNQKVKVDLLSQQNGDVGDWYLKVSYSKTGNFSEVIQRIDLGLSRSDQDFTKELKFIKAGKPLLIKEDYTVPHGKKSRNSNSANEVVA